MLNLNYQVNIFASCRTRKFAAALGRTLTRWLKKNYPKTKEIRSRTHVMFLGQVWYLIVSIPDLCPLSYFENVSDPPEYILTHMAN